MPGSRDQHYDIVIIGAGMVGSSLACALAQTGQRNRGRILLVESSAVHADTEPLQPGYDMRSTVLSAGTVGYFEQLGLWDPCRTHAEAITDIHVSDKGHLGTVRLNCRDEGVPALGYVVPNAALGRTLNRALLQHPQLELLAPANVREVKPGGAGMQLRLAAETGEQSITASLVVLAEGGRSGLCRQLGIETEVRHYGQSAVIANVSFSKAHQGVAYERFTPKGPLALLPLPDHGGEHRAALVWTHAADQADAWLQLPERDFLRALQDDFGDRLGIFTRVGSRQAFSLSLQLAREQIRPALVLLGNVAHTLHPVAGQGFNLALRDAMLLAGNIRQSLEQATDPGEFKRLLAYRRASERDQRLTISFSDYMTRLFSSTSWTLQGLRQFGMASIDLLPPFKHALSRQAMGMAHPRASLR